MSPRFGLALLIFAGLIGGVIAIVKQGQLPPAEFTFNNGTEIKSLDPAVLTDNASGRIASELYEGLVRRQANGKGVAAGAAESWDISDDGRTYTFRLRKDAKWSDGEPVTADDIVFSMRRFLDLRTKSEYAYLAWHLENSESYSLATRGVEPGDPVEVELFELPEDAKPFARGRLEHGRLVRIETDPTATAEALGDDQKFAELRVFVVEREDGQEVRYRVSYDATKPEAEAADWVGDARYCRMLALDFREVGIRAVDASTVEMQLESPTPYWLELLAFYPLSPVSRRCVESHGPGQWNTVENVVTNGPYQIEFRRLRDRIRLKKNPYYWNADQVSIETIDALVVESLTTSFNLYETGGIDWMDKVPPLISRELLKSDPPRNDFNPSAQLATYFFRINTTRKPLDDPRVRRALAMAVDRDEIIRVAGAGELPALSLTPPGLAGYDSPMCPALDVERARALLAEAGFPGGAGFPKIEILYNNSDEHQTIAELIRKQWRRGLSIDVSTANQEWTTMLASQRQLKYDVSRLAWIGDYVDPNTFLDLFVTGGENNNTGWGNKEYDRLIEEAKHVVDPEQRLEKLRRVEEILMTEMPIIPIYYYVSRNLVRPRVRGFYNNLQDLHPLSALRLDPDQSGPNEYMTSGESRSEEALP